MQLHRPSISIIDIPSHAKSSLRSYAQAVAISTAYVLKSYFPYDQDHYGGLAATDELAREAQVSNGSRVADFCAGLGGTVRYLAHKYGADVTGIELTPARVSGAQELTRRVGLHCTARIVEGNVMDVPLPDASIDAVVSQEAFCHDPDVKRAVAEAFRILRTDGRLAFTDWIANQPLTAVDAQLMWEGMAI